MTYIFKNLGSEDVFDGTAGSFVADSWPYLRDVDTLRMASTDSNLRAISEPQQGALITLTGNEGQVVAKRITGISVRDSGGQYVANVLPVASHNANEGGAIAELIVNIFSGYCTIGDIEALTGIIYTGCSSPKLENVARLITAAYNDVNSRAKSLGITAPFDPANNPESYSKATDLSVEYVIAHLQQRFDAQAFALLLREYRNKWVDIQKGVDSFTDATASDTDPQTEAELSADGLLQGRDALTSVGQWGVI